MGTPAPASALYPAREAGVTSPPDASLRGRLGRRLRRMPPARRQRWALAWAALAAEDAGRPLRVLDAGCEDALFTVDVARRRPGWRIVGLDLSEDAVAMGLEEQRRAGVTNLLLACADATRPLTAVPVDVVVALECLAEIPDDRAAAARFAEALRPGGLLVAHVPVADWRPALARSARTWRREVRHGYTPEGLTELLTSSGFTDVRLSPTMRSTVMVAQEVRDHVKHSPGAVRAALYPAMVAAARLDAAGATWGPSRGLFVTARRE